MDFDLMRQRLVQAREFIGYNRKQFAEELGIPYRTVTNYENGAREPGSDYITKVADFCGCTTDWLLGLTDSAREKSPYTSGAQKTNTLLSYQENELAKKYRTLDEYGKEAVDAVLEVEYRRCHQDVTEFAAARNGQRARIEHVENPDDLLPSDDLDNV